MRKPPCAALGLREHALLPHSGEHAAQVQQHIDGVGRDIRLRVRDVGADAVEVIRPRDVAENLRNRRPVQRDAPVQDHREVRRKVGVRAAHRVGKAVRVARVGVAVHVRKMQLERRGVDEIPAVPAQHDAHLKPFRRRLPVQPVHGLEQPQARFPRGRRLHDRDVIDVALPRIEPAERERPVQVEADEIAAEDFRVRAPDFGQERFKFPAHRLTPPRRRALRGRRPLCAARVFSARCG